MSAAPNSRTAECCAICRFYRPGPSDVIGVADDEAGDCRREPPRVVAGVSPQAWGVWPAVSADDWCGKYERRRAD